MDPDFHHLRLLLNLFLIFSLPFFPVVFSDLEADRVALLRLRDSVGGTTLTWNTTTTTNPSPCQWEGVRCDETINRVTQLRLPGDRLSGQLPENTLGNLTRLRVLSLRHNSLSGPIPSDLRLCTELKNINLEGNRFSGDIPDGLFQLSNLERLNLAGNEFSGQISPGFNSLWKLRTLYLQNNRFNGSLPQLNNLSDLQQFNVSFNRLNGSIPERLNGFLSNSFLNNSLCGGPLPSCPKLDQSNDGGNNNTDQSNDGGNNNLSAGAIAGIVLGSVLGLIFILLIILFISRKKYRIGKQPGKQPVILSPLPPPSPAKKSPGHDFKIPRPHLIVREDSKGMSNGTEANGIKKRKVSSNGGEGGLVFFGDKHQLFSLDELLRASAEVLGKGIVGTTYRAYLETGEDVVVKRLRNVCVSEEEFREKVENLGLLDHKNLVPLKAYFFGKDERLIVYESFPTSLHSILHGPSRPSLTWIIRCRIALGIAFGLEYLHSLGSNIISHGSIKSSNIMLNRNYDPFLSEYCITNLISSVSSKSSQNQIGNGYGYGYGAPEVIDSRKVSQKADVYSFGVLLLELLTGKDPQRTSSNDSEEINIHHLPKWVRSVVQERWTIQVFDTELLKHTNNSEEQMVQLLHLAIACTSRLPEKRPLMKDVAVRIKGICGVPPPAV